jgi:hypothetical protein
MPHTVEGDSFGPTEESPIVYAQIGVSAADGAVLTKDDPKWPVPGWGGRDGNESRIAAPAQIFRVRREKPARPEPPVEPEMANASPADYYGQSFYTYRWRPAAGMKVHVFRALDDALFNFDWQRISGPGSSPASRLPIVDPNETDQTRNPFPFDWPPARRKAAADALNAVASLDDYQKLSNDALRVLASLPENERAFTQVTVSPLDPDDPANSNRRGPDNKEGFVVDPGLRAFVDALEGLSDNRYFYRMAYVNEAQNNSTLSISGPPVYLQDVVAPRAPVITKVLGGDRQITISWASNREPDLKEYRIYRTDSEENAHNLDRMMQLDVESESRDPSERPAEITWTDGTAPSLMKIYYRVAAVDIANNVSVPSPIVAARALDNSSPDSPTWDSPSSGSMPNSISLSWVSPIADLGCLVQRRQSGSVIWVNVSGWLARGAYSFIDEKRDAGIVYDYRLKVQDTLGRQNRDFNILTI